MFDRANETKRCPDVVGTYITSWGRKDARKECRRLVPRAILEAGALSRSRQRARGCTRVIARERALERACINANDRPSDSCTRARGGASSRSRVVRRVRSRAHKYIDIYIYTCRSNPRAYLLQPPHPTHPLLDFHRNRLFIRYVNRNTTYGL